MQLESESASLFSGTLLKASLLVQEQPNLGTKLAAEAAAVSDGGE